MLHTGLLMNMSGDLQHDLFGHQLDAGRHVHVLLFQHRLRLPRRKPKQFAETISGHGQSLTVVEVLHIHPEAAIITNIDQVLKHFLCIDRATVWREPHQFVLTTVDLKTTVISDS